MTEKTPPAKKTTARPTKKAPAKKAAPRRTPARKTTAKKAPAKKAPATKAQRATPRDRQVLELRRAGVTFDVIADQLKYRDAEAAHAAFIRALTAVLPAPPDETKRLELDRLERLQTPLWAKAMKGDLAALDRLVGIAQERRRLVSTDPLPPSDKRGPIETATAEECATLTGVAPALAAAALVLARVVDESTSDAGSTATAARELRMTMTQLRGLAGTATIPKPSGGDAEPGEGTGKEGAVTFLDELRNRRDRRKS